ncbi:MAG: prenyltransferase/squalene oxidase repeat-containing protein [Planctomycetota bacterium]
MAMVAAALRRVLLIGLIASGVIAARPAAALDAEHRALGEETLDRGIAFLRQTQNPDGSWTPQTGPAVTGLIVAAMLDQPDIDPNDPAVAKALTYILDRVQPDGSIRDGENGILANYNTAICLSALSRVRGNPDVAHAIRGAQLFLKDLQWSVGDTAPDGTAVTREHPYFGGAGYGRHGRPDMSNTQIMLQGLHDSGVSSEDPAYARAVAFIARCQGTPGNTYFPKGTIVEDGGIIYATSINQEHPDIPVSYANPDLVDEARAGRPVSGLRGYGSVTYAGFKSFLYADLDRDDPRVVGALAWIQNNYTLDQNPGMPEAVKNQGLFYYYMTHARALNAWGSPTLDLADGDDPINWANNLIAKLASLQQTDGSFVNAEPRWMEDDPGLVTAYALIALNEAIR